VEGCDSKGPLVEEPSPATLSPDQSRALLEHGRKLYDSRQFQESEAIFRRLIGSGYTSDGFYGIGRVRMVLGDFAGATLNLASSLAANSQNANAWYQLGVIAEQQRSFEKARSCYANALSVNPRLAGATERLRVLDPNSRADQPIGRPNAAASRTDVQRTISSVNKLGVYEFLLRDNSPLSKQTVAAMNSLEMSVIPRLTAYSRQLLWCTAFIWIIVSILAHGPGRRGFFGFVRTVDLVYALLRQLGLGHTMTLSALNYIALVLILVVVLILANIRATRIMIDKGRLQVKEGLFSTSVRNIELWRVEDVQLIRSLINRLTGDGSLIVHYIQDRKSKTVELKGLASGGRLEEIRRQLLDLVFLLRANPTVKGIIY
jgi:tetratricopeptide (TPR) repeat protein